MALRTKINVDVEAASLNESVAALSRFAKACEQSNSLWDKYGASAYAAQKTSRELQDVFDRQNATLAQSTNLHLKFGTAGEKVGKVFKGLADDTKNIALNLGKIALSFVDIMSVFGIVGGLVGLGTGLFGADALAHVISARRKAALRFGSTYGEVTAFGVDFARYGDTSSMLSAVGEGLYDVSSPAYIALLNAGAIRPSLRNAGSATDALINTIRNIPQLFAGVKDGGIGARSRALGLDTVMSNQDIARLREHPEDIEKTIAKYKEDATRFNISTDAQEKWASFSTALDRAKQNMETILGEKLSSLADPIGEISSGLANVIDALSQSPVIGGLLNTIEGKLKWLIDKLGGKDAQSGFANFLAGMEALVPVTQKILGASKIALMIASGNYSWQQIFDAIKAANIDVQRNYNNQIMPPDSSGGGFRQSDFHGGSIRHGSRLPVGLRNYPQFHDPGSRYIQPGGTIQTVPYPPTTFRNNGVAPIEGASIQHLATRIQQIYPTFTNQECVQLAFRMAGYDYTSANVAAVRAGPSAMDPSVPAGTPVGTFFSSAGVPSTQYAGGTGGRPGVGLDHMGVKWPTSDSTHLDLLNQWRGHAPSVSNYGRDDRTGTEYAGSSYRVLLDEAGLPIGTWEENPMRRQVLAGIAADRFAKGVEAQNAYQQRQKMLQRRKQLENRESFLDTLRGAKDPKAVFVVDNSQGMIAVSSHRMASAFG